MDAATLRVVHARLKSETECMICRDVIVNAVCSKECLHRFCKHCIEACLRKTNLECPVCRKHLRSKRSFCPDPAFDALLATLYGDVAAFNAREEAFLGAIPLESYRDSAEGARQAQILLAQQEQKKKRRSRLPGLPSTKAPPPPPPRWGPPWRRGRARRGGGAGGSAWGGSPIPRFAQRAWPALAWRRSTGPSVGACRPNTTPRCSSSGGPSRGRRRGRAPSRSAWRGKACGLCLEGVLGPFRWWPRQTLSSRRGPGVLSTCRRRSAGSL